MLVFCNMSQECYTPRLWMTVTCVNGQACAVFVEWYNITQMLHSNFLHLVTSSQTVLVTYSCVYLQTSCLRTVCCEPSLSVFSTNTKYVRGSVDITCSSEFLFSSMFTGRFSYLTNNFHVTASIISSPFSSGSPEVSGKINFPNMFVVFASVYTA